MDLLEALNFVQSVTGPTQEYGHKLDLVLAHGLSIFNVQIIDPVFSDHISVLFDFNLPCPSVKPPAPAHLCCSLKPSTAAQFASVFKKDHESMSRPSMRS